MEQNRIEFFKSYTPVTILLFIVGTFIYGGMSTWAIIKNGFHFTLGEFCLYGWGYLMMLISWICTYFTIKAWRHGSK